MIGFRHLLPRSSFTFRMVSRKNEKTMIFLPSLSHSSMISSILRALLEFLTSSTLHDTLLDSTNFLFKTAFSYTASSSGSSDTAAEINREFRSAKKVDPFTVTVRPSRASGWVNLRWAPSKSAELMATYKQNEKLLVIKETNNWYQVEDQDTGDVGFINKQFVVQ